MHRIRVTCNAVRSAADAVSRVSDEAARSLKRACPINEKERIEKKETERVLQLS